MLYIGIVLGGACASRAREGGLPAAMASMSPECQEAKHEYDKCFNAVRVLRRAPGHRWMHALMRAMQWYADKFLKNRPGASEAVPCEALFNAYRACVQVRHCRARRASLSSSPSGRMRSSRRACSMWSPSKRSCGIAAARPTPHRSRFPGRAMPSRWRLGRDSERVCSNTGTRSVFSSCIPGRSPIPADRPSERGTETPRDVRRLQ